MTATSYLDLCTPDVCDDGAFLGTTTATIVCPYGGNFAARRSPKQTDVAKYVGISSAWFTQPTSFIVVSRIPVVNGQAMFRVRARRSRTCTATSVRVQGDFATPAYMLWYSNPTSTLQTLTFASGKSTSENQWFFSTKEANAMPGMVDGNASIDSVTGCRDSS